MSFRDDHDAALARATALQAELERARADDDRQERRIAQLEARLAEADAQRQVAEAELAKLRPPPLPDFEPRVVRGPGLTPLVVGLLVTLLIGLIVVSRCDRERAVEDPPIAAVVRSTPVVDELWPLMTDELRGRDLGTLAQLTLRGVRQDGSFDEATGELEATFAGKDDCHRVRKRKQGGWTVDARDPTELPCRFGEIIEIAGTGHYPTCSARSIWIRALGEGASASDLAELRFEHREWHFQTPSFKSTYRDDCH